jgi:hypothetical protein
VNLKISDSLVLSNSILKKGVKMAYKKAVEQFIQQVRSYQPHLPPTSVREIIACLPTETGDKNARFRMMVLYTLLESFSLEDRAFIRLLLEQEIEHHRYNQGFSESIKVAAFLVFVLAEVEDVQLVWKAKTTSFDTMCGLDDQLLIGAGSAVTLDYLHRANELWSEEASTYIAEMYPYTFEQLQSYQIETKQRLIEHTKILYSQMETPL